jgi:hypothetical protein
MTKFEASVDLDGTSLEPFFFAFVALVFFCCLFFLPAVSDAPSAACFFVPAPAASAGRPHAPVGLSTDGLAMPQTLRSEAFEAVLSLSEAASRLFFFCAAALWGALPWLLAVAP